MNLKKTIYLLVGIAVLSSLVGIAGTLGLILLDGTARDFASYAALTGIAILFLISGCARVIMVIYSSKIREKE